MKDPRIHVCFLSAGYDRGTSIWYGRVVGDVVEIGLNISGGTKRSFVKTVRKGRSLVSCLHSTVATSTEGRGHRAGSMVLEVSKNGPLGGRGITIRRKRGSP